MFVYCVSRSDQRAFTRACVALAAYLAALSGLFLHGPARGEDLGEAPSFWDRLALPPGRIETSNGGDLTDTAWSGYSAMVIAPFGPLDQDGFRLKLFGSASAWSYERKDQYDYCKKSSEQRKKETGTNFSDTCNRVVNGLINEDERKHINNSLRPHQMHLEGDQIYRERMHQVTRYDFAVMPGYQASWNALTVKAYLGPAMETRNILPADPDKLLSGASWGAKTALEGWLALGENLWLTADASYFTGTRGYSMTLRPGYQVLDWLALGPEAAAFGDAEDDSARAGGFLRATIGKAEATFSAGFSSDYDGGAGIYGSAGVYTKF